MKPARADLALLALASLGGAFAFAGSIWATEGSLGRGPFADLDRGASSGIFLVSYYAVQPVLLLLGWLSRRWRGLAVAFIGLEIGGAALYILNPIATFGDEASSWTLIGLLAFGVAWLGVVPLAAGTVGVVVRRMRSAESR